MKTILALAITAILAGEAFAGCGVKIDVEGELTKFDDETKEITVGRKTVTLLASANITGGSKIEDLIGKMVVVSTDKHTKKGESVMVKEGDDPVEEADEPKAMKSSLLAEKQDWTNSAGVTITAAVNKVEKGKVYFLKDGKVIPYEVSKLSAETIDRLKAIIAAKKQ